RLPSDRRDRAGRPRRRQPAAVRGEALRPLPDGEESPGGGRHRRAPVGGDGRRAGADERRAARSGDGRREPPAARGGLRAGRDAGGDLGRRHRRVAPAADVEPARHDARRRLGAGDVARHLPRQPRRSAAAHRGARAPGRGVARRHRRQRRKADRAAARVRQERARASRPGLAMAGRLRAPLAGVVLAAAAVVPGWGCADMFQQQQPGASASAAPGPRTAPDDSDLWNLVQASADVVAEADMAALRASPWSSSIMQTNHQAQLAGQLLFGYDIFTESDRLMQVTFDAAGAQRNLTILRGTFDPARVHAAFVAATPGATEGRWRESPIWEGNGRAVALVTPRTLVQGDPGDVRGAIDAAWGVVPDARAVPIGAARRSLDADHPGPAAFIAFNVTEGMQGRAASMGFGQVPPGLALGAARLDLGDD